MLLKKLVAKGFPGHDSAHYDQVPNPNGLVVIPATKNLFNAYYSVPEDDLIFYFQFRAFRCSISYQTKF